MQSDTGIASGTNPARWHRRTADERTCFPQFLFATGFEGSYPRIALPSGKSMRVDEFEKCGHYEHWKEDFELVREMGIDFLCYGPPYYCTHTGPGQYDWSFADETFNRLRELGIKPIADLSLRRSGLAG